MTETPNPNIVDADTLTGEMRPIRRVVISLGSNLGDSMSTLQGAVDAIADTPDVWVTSVSPVYETEPGRLPARLAELPQRRRCWPTPRWPPTGCWSGPWPSRTPTTASAARSPTPRAPSTST